MAGLTANSHDAGRCLERFSGWGTWAALLVLLSGPSTLAQTPTIPRESPPPHVAALVALDRQSLPVIATALTPSQRGLTVPSLWWADDQFGDKLVENWIVYARRPNTQARTDLIIRRALWNTLNYYERYAVVNRFGTVASDYGYNLLVFDRENDLLAAYTCSFSRVAPDYLEEVRDFRGNPVPDYVPAAKPSRLPCQLWLNPTTQLRRFF